MKTALFISCYDLHLSYNTSVSLALKYRFHALNLLYASLVRAGPQGSSILTLSPPDWTEGFLKDRDSILLIFSFIASPEARWI